MQRNLLIGLAVLVAAGSVHADSNVINVDEVALKATAPVTQRTVLTPLSTVSYTGTNVGGPEWDRPFADGTCCSGLGPVRYTTQEFSLSSADTCDIESIQDEYDGYLLIYSAPFSATSQTVNFVAGDDDGDGGIGTSNIDGLALAGSTTYVAVTTGFENGEEGAFTNTISCPTAVVTLGGFVATAPVSAPTMSASGLALLGALMLVVGLVVVRSRSH